MTDTYISNETQLTHRKSTKLVINLVNSGISVCVLKLKFVFHTTNALKYCWLIIISSVTAAAAATVA